MFDLALAEDVRTGWSRIPRKLEFQPGDNLDNQSLLPTPNVTTTLLTSTTDLSRLGMGSATHEQCGHGGRCHSDDAQGAGG